MKTRTRFINSVIATAKTTRTDLPWARGVIRAGHAKARRNAGAKTLRSAC